MIFGLEEDADEQISEMVGQVMMELGENLQLEVCEFQIYKCSNCLTIVEYYVSSWNNYISHTKLSMTMN